MYLVFVILIFRSGSIEVVLIVTFEIPVHPYDVTSFFMRLVMEAKHPQHADYFMFLSSVDESSVAIDDHDDQMGMY